MSKKIVEEHSPRSKEELDAHTDMVIQRENTLRILHPNMSEEDIYRQAESYVSKKESYELSKKQMQTTNQQDLPSRDAKPGSGNHNNKHNFRDEGGKFIPSPEDSPNKSPNKPSNITTTHYRMRQGIRFRTSRRVAGTKKYPEYRCHNTGWFIDIPLNISKMTPEELNHSEFPANVPHWRLRSHPHVFKGLDITKIPSEEQRYFGGRPVICNSELKQDSCGLAVTGLKNIMKHFPVDEKGHVRMQCIKCTKRTSKRRRDAIRKAEGRKKGQRMPVGKGRPKCINGNLCMGTKMKPQFARKNYRAEGGWKLYCEACYFNKNYPVKPSTSFGSSIQPSDQSDEEYHKEVRKSNKSKADKYDKKFAYIHGGVGNQNARKYSPSPTPKQRYAIRKGKGYWDDETQSFKTGTRPR